MRARILDRHVLRQMAAAMGVCLAAMLAMLLSVRLLDVVRLLLGRALSPAQGVQFMASLLPPLLLPSLPAAVLMAVFLTCRLLAAQNEVTAMKAAGLGMAAWLRPAAAFGAAMGLLAAAVSLWAVPWAAATQQVLLEKVSPAGMIRVLLARGVAEPVAGVTIRAHADPQNPAELMDVALVDRRDPGGNTFITARRATLIRPSEQSGWSLRLTEGTATRLTPHADGPDVAGFQTLEFGLSGSPAASRYPRIRGLALPRLRQLASDPLQAPAVRRDAGLELHRRLALPFACLVVALAAAPLGIRADPNGRASGVAPALLVFILYYALHTMGGRLSRAGFLPPGLAMGLPNVAVGLLGIHLSVMAGLDRRPWELRLRRPAAAGGRRGGARAP